MMMMRLALAAALLPAASAAPTCTEASCCVPMVQGMCAGNTHDASGKKATDVGYTASEVTEIACSGATPENKGVGQTGRDATACCRAATPTVAVATCGDKDGDGAETAAVSATDCGAGWIVDAGAAAATCVGTACDMNLEADKIACCHACALGEVALAAGATCDAHADCAAGEGYSGDTSTTFVAGTHCTECTAGKFAAAGHNTCEDCAAGKFSAAGAATCTACTADVDFAPIPGATACTAKSTTLTTCPAGEGFATSTTTADSSCTACVAGSTFSAAVDANGCGAVTSRTCAPGEGFSSDATASADGTLAGSCTDCPAGKAGAGGVDAAATCVSCEDGKFSAIADNSITTTAGATQCISCTPGTDFDDDGIPTTACTPKSTTLTTCPAGEGFATSTATADSSCTACVAGSTFNAAVDANGCGAVTSRTCAAGKGFSSDATASADGTLAGSCTDCPAGKAGAGGVDAAATCVDCAAGFWSAVAATTCTACGGGTTVAAGAGKAATDCVANSEYCLEASADTDTDTDTDGQNYACPAGKYVASNYVPTCDPAGSCEEGAAVAAVAQCTAVKATGAAITETATTCVAVPAEEAATFVAAVNIGDRTAIDLTGPDTYATAAVVAVTANDAVTASCTQATGSGGSCTLAVPVSASGGAAGKCPEPVKQDKTNGAAVAAPLAIAAVLAAVFA